MNKRKCLVMIVIAFIMTGALYGTNFIKLEAIWGETNLHEVLSMILFPWFMINKIFNLANHFTNWLFKPTEE